MHYFVSFSVDQLKPYFCSVLYKRRLPMKEVELVILNHNIHGGTIMLYNLFALYLSDNTVYGTKIGKSIQCLENGFDINSQTFLYTCFGRCLDYVGPCLNLSLLETLCLVYAGISVILLWCSSIVQCYGKPNECRNYKNMSQALETSLYSGLIGVVSTLMLLLIYQCIFKRLNAKWNNVGNIWFCMQILPAVVIGSCIATGNTNRFLC